MSCKELALKVIGIGSAFLVLSFGLLYTFQDRMLYIPDMPIRHIKDNPRHYRSPQERNIKYETISLAIEGAPNDSVTGWHMRHDDEDSNRPTVLFMHENAGNLGLRLDYFQMLYHELDLDVIAFAYRGYSDSHLESGFPNEQILKQDASQII